MIKSIFVCGTGHLRLGYTNARHLVLTAWTCPKMLPLYVTHVALFGTCERVHLDMFVKARANDLSRHDKWNDDDNWTL